MRITEVRVRQIAVPRVYDTYCADPEHLKATINHGKYSYQIIELKTHDGLTGIGEVSDIAPRMDAPSPRSLQDIVSSVQEGGDPAAVSWVAYLRGNAALEEELQVLELEMADQVGSGMKAFKLKVGEDHERDLARVRLAGGSREPERRRRCTSPFRRRASACPRT